MSEKANDSRTDRELLELAAKAGRLNVDFECEVCGYFGIGYDEGGDVDKWWNPLMDDGDALQLAVLLRLDISPQPDGNVEVSNQWDSPDELRWAWEAYGNNAHAATRRAIVKAAAEIGAHPIRSASSSAEAL